MPFQAFGMNSGAESTNTEKSHFLSSGESRTEMNAQFPVEFPFAETGFEFGYDMGNVLDQGNQSEPYQKIDFDVKGTPNITVKSVNGSIQMIPGDSRTVRVELYVTRRGLTVLGTDRLGDDYRIVIRQRNDLVVAEVISLKGGSWSTNTPTFNFVVYAPINSNASLSTNNGDITITDIRGNIDVRSSSGDIHLVNTRGTSRLSSTSGNIQVNKHSGTVFTNAIAGDVNYQDVTGECRIKVLSGNVTLDNIRGSSVVHTTNGNIELNISRIDVLLDLETVVGNIRTTLPSTGALNLAVQGQRVNMNAARNFDGAIQRNSINGKMNGGGIPVRMKSAVGSIDIHLRQNN
jgi:hypothetical protein